MMSTPFEAFKHKEHLGDLLLRVIVTDILLRRGVRRTDVSRHVNKYVSNEHLAAIFDALSLQFHPDDIGHDDNTSKPHKRKGNTVEFHVWQTFEMYGYKFTRDYYEKFIRAQVDFEERK